MRKSVAELCFELLDIQLEDDASVVDNVEKVLLCAKAPTVKMDTMEAEYKARIEELEKRDPIKQLKEVAKEIAKQIAFQIKDTTHLLETTTESWMGIEQITTVEEVCMKIQQVEAEIVKLKEETTGLTPIQRMVQLGKSKKLQIQLQRLREDETKFMKVT